MTAFASGRMRGSRLRMCEWINDRPEQFASCFDQWASLRDCAAAPLEWIAPLAGDGYRELRDGLWSAACLPQPSPQEAGFWPARGPQWDGVATVRCRDGEPGVLLVEAKSHVDELASSPTKAGGSRRMQIRGALDEVKRYLNVQVASDWTEEYYQLTNRLAFLYYLRARLGYRAWLLWVYFTGDHFGREGSRVFPTDEQAWRPWIDGAKQTLALPKRHKLAEFTFEAFVPATPPTSHEAAVHG